MHETLKYLDTTKMFQIPFDFAYIEIGRCKDSIWRLVNDAANIEWDDWVSLILDLQLLGPDEEGDEPGVWIWFPWW